MNREHVRADLLNDYAEALLDPVAADHVAAHVALCPRCAAEVESIRALRAAAGSLPPSLDPGVDLRPAIRARRARGPRAGDRQLPGTRGTRFVAAAAVLVLGLASAPAVVRLLDGRGAGEGPVAELPRGTPTVLVLDREYARAAEELRARLELATPRMAPDAARLLRTNMSAVDRALAESRAALREDPASPVLRELVMATHRQRLEVLRQAAALAAESEEAT